MLNSPILPILWGLGNTFQIYRDFPDESAAKRDIDLARELNPELLSYEQFLATYKDRFQL